MCTGGCTAVDRQTVNISSPPVSHRHSDLCVYRIRRVPGLQTTTWTGKLNIIYRLQKQKLEMSDRPLRKMGHKEEQRM